jgi:CheY-like chemotaxis protein
VSRVLVVDDDPNARLLLRTLLTHAGHETLEAADGETALASASETQPDLVILDLSMPGMGGTGLVRALRHEPRTKGLAIALYTASTIDAATRDFMEMYGIAGALPKPSDPRALLAAIEALL